MPCYYVQRYAWVCNAVCYVGQSASLTNIIWKHVSFMGLMQSAIWLITRCSTCQPGWTSVAYSYVSLSGFLIVLPYLVFIIFLLCCVLILSSLGLFTVFLHGILPPLQDIFGCCSCVFWMLLLLLWMGLFAYACGLSLMCSRIASSGSICLFVCFVAW